MRYITKRNKDSNTILFPSFTQRHQLVHHTVPDYTVSLPMNRNATCSGTVGTVKRPGINARPVWHMTVRLAFVCGPIKYPNVETKVSATRKYNTIWKQCEKKNN